MISGAESQVDSLDPQDLKLVVDARDLPKGQLIFSPRIVDGKLYFEVRTAGQSEEEVRVFEVKGRLTDYVGGGKPYADTRNRDFV